MQRCKAAESTRRRSPVAGLCDVEAFRYLGSGRRGDLAIGALELETPRGRLDSAKWNCRASRA